MRALFLVVLALLPASLHAQALQPGDIALVSMMADDPDAFAFVALTDLAAGTELLFTDNGWKSTGEFRANEQIATWTAGAAVAAGTVVTLTCDGSTTAASTGSVDGALCGLSVSGDQVLAYQMDGATPRFVYALNSEGAAWQSDASNSNTSALPAGLTDGETAVALVEFDNQVYVGIVAGSRAELLAAIGTPANWTGTDERGDAPALPPGFTVSGSTTPTVTFLTTDTSISETSATPLAVRVVVTPAPAATETVTVSLAGGTASFIQDFMLADTLLTFGPGKTADTAYVQVIDDDLLEGDETLTLVLRNASAGLDVRVPDRIVITITDDDAPVSSFVPIATARAEGKGATVTVRGVVTRAMGDFVRIQDATAALTLRQVAGTLHDDVASGALTPGDTVQVTGVLSEFNGLLQINDADLTAYTRIASGSTLPTPTPLTLAQLMASGEDYESALVRIENLTTTATGTFAERQSYDVTDGTATVTLRTPNAADTEIDGEAIPAGAFTYVGVVSQFSTSGSGGYQLSPVERTDVRGAGPSGPTRFAFVASAATTSEEAGTFSFDVTLTNPSLTDAASVDVALTGGTATNGDDIALFETTTLTFPATSTARQRVTLTLVDDGLDEGEETLIFTLQNPEGGQDAALGSPATFTLTLRDEGVGYVTLFPGAWGTALLDSLRRVYTPTTLGYSEARRRLFGKVWNDGGVVEAIYTGALVTVPQSASDPTGTAFDRGMNTEHAFPQSKGAEDEPRKSDLHNLFPSLINVNSDRGSLPFGEVDDAQATDWYRRTTRRSALPTDSIDAWSERGQGRFEPRESVKGEMARSQFYFFALYQASASVSYFNSMKEDLYTWHRLDPVTVMERVRNDRIRQQQGNDNPFVLDSSLVRRAFFHDVNVAAEKNARPAAFAVEALYPNPTDAALTVRLALPAPAVVDLRVFDVLGRVVLAEPAVTFGSGSTPYRLDTARLPAGLYVLQTAAQIDGAPVRAAQTFSIVR